MGEFRSFKEIAREALRRRTEGSVISIPIERECKICSDRGFLTPSVMTSDPRFGTIEPCECRQSPDVQQVRRMAYSGLEPLLQRLTFESFHKRRDKTAPNNAAMTDENIAALAGIAGFAREYAEGTVAAAWLVIAGTKGWGKTHLAVAILNYRIAHTEAGPIGKFIEVPIFLNHLREGFADNSYTARLRAAQDAELLVLDDLGTQYEKATDSGMSWAGEQIYMLINHRYSRQLPTIITTNVTVAQMDGRVRDRILDRGTGLCRVFGATIPSFRTGQVEG